MRDLAEDADEARRDQGQVKSIFAEPALWNWLSVTGLVAWGALPRVGTCNPHRAPFECARVGMAAVLVFAAA
jgi:hypothetical protein